MFMILVRKFLNVFRSFGQERLTFKDSWLFGMWVIVPVPIIYQFLANNSLGGQHKAVVVFRTSEATYLLETMKIIVVKPYAKHGSISSPDPPETS